MILMAKVCVIDYGSGNVKSVFNLVSYLGHPVVVSHKSGDIKAASHLILPGVGSFGDAMQGLRERVNLPDLENEVLGNKKPFLGICVGMQVLAQTGSEHGTHEGLGWIPGTVERLDSRGSPLPHVGWNAVSPRPNASLFSGLDSTSDFYFIHSYAVKTDPEFIASETEYANLFCSSIQNNNIFGVQFHPEKSQKSGQRLLSTFLGF
jgi:glutamine amidotransferase